VLDYLIRRLASTIPVLLAVAAFVFLFVHLLPGDPARLVAGPDASPQDIAAVRADMGLDRPLPMQFLLPFLSSVFVPAATMPVAVRWFTAHQPFTPVVESLRALLTGSPVGSTGYAALAWCAAIALVGYVWSRAAFRRGTR